MEIITQLKSWLNVELAVGCPNACAYCYRHTDGDFELKTPKPTAPLEEVIEMLLKHPFFIPNETHLSICGTKTDAFLPQNKDRTFKFMELLDEKGYRNRIAIVTKGLITREDARNLKSFSNITPVVFVSYSEMPLSIESVPNGQRISSLESLSKEGVKTVLYWRPLIEGYNTSDKQLEKVLDVGERLADAFVLSGLRVSPEIKSYMESIGLKLPDENWNYAHKIFPEKTKSRIFKIYANKGCRKPLFLKSSCAVSYFENAPDFNAHWTKPEKNCAVYCPEIQKERCASQSDKIVPEIRKDLSREEITFYRQKYRLPINV